MINSLGRSARARAAGLGILGLCALGGRAQEPIQGDPPVQADAPAAGLNPETALRSWPNRSRVLGSVMIDKYGDPNRSDENRLVWYKNGPWLRSVVYRKAPRSDMGLSRKDILEQAIVYPLADDKVAQIRLFDSRLAYDASNGELSSRAASEDLNFLAINLANDIATGKRTVEDARDFYRKTVKLSESGKASGYMDEFDFPARGGAPPAPEAAAPPVRP